MEWQEEQSRIGYDIAISYVDVTDFQSCADTVWGIVSKFGNSSYNHWDNWASIWSNYQYFFKKWEKRRLDKLHDQQKMEFMALQKSLAREVARKGITVNTILPGYIETKMVISVADEIRDKIITQVPIGHLVKKKLLVLLAF